MKNILFVLLLTALLGACQDDYVTTAEKNADKVREYLDMGINTATIVSDTHKDMDTYIYSLEGTFLITKKENTVVKWNLDKLVCIEFNIDKLVFYFE